MRVPSRTGEPWSADAASASAPIAFAGGTARGNGYNTRPDGEYLLAPVGPRSEASAPASLAGDAKLAVVFRQIRAIHSISETEMARRLGTGIDVVLSFEAGTVDQLPPWPETARLVERYAALGGVDPAPLLSRLLSLQTLPYAPPPSRTASPPHTEFQPVPPPRANVARGTDALVDIDAQNGTADGGPIGFAARPRLKGEPTTGRPRPPRVDVEIEDAGLVTARRRRRLRSTAMAVSPLILIAAMFVLVQAAPRAVYAVANAMPGPIETATRGMIDMMTAQTATFKDGLRWIEISDPRLRKSHRLSNR